MNTAHYTLIEQDDRYWFTSPLGNHFAHFAKAEATKVLHKVMDAHRERSKGSGAEAALLAPFFSDEDAPVPGPMPDIIPDKVKPPKAKRSRITTLDKFVSNLHRP